MHQSSMESCARFISKYLEPNDKLTIADVGSMDVNGTYKELIIPSESDQSEAAWLKRQNWQYFGIDIQAGKNVDIVVSPDDLDWKFACSRVWDQPTKNGLGQFDVVISGQCLEHTRKPWVWIKQVASILQSNGLVFITAPNTWEYHPYPVDCWRVWPDGLAALFDEAGIVPLELGTTGPYENDTYGIGLKP